MKFKTVKNDVRRRLQNMVKAGKSPKAYLNRVLFRQYQAAQAERWMSISGNSGGTTSEGDNWDPLTSRYRKWKEGRRGFLAGGRRMLVATGRLEKAVVRVLPPDGKKVVTDNSLIVTTSIPYAKYVAESRNFVGFGKETIAKMREGLADYLAVRK